MDRSIFDAKEQILQNGIRLVTIKKNTQISSVHIGVKIGALYEKKDEKGISHFIEHMLFKGTKNRSNEKLNNDLEQRGGEYNAYTDRNCTVYSMTALSEELSVCIDILSDMVQNSTFPEDEIEKERGVILAEIRTSKDDVEDYSFQKLHEMAFNKSPLKYDIIGEERIIKKITKEQLVKFYDKYYVPNNCYISIVSPYEHDEIFNLVEKYFKEWIWKEFNREKVIVEQNIPGKKTSFKKDIEQSTIIYAYTFHNLELEGELALKILNHKFGESSNSILFRELREERGLAYDVYSDLDLTDFVKAMYIYTAVSVEGVDEAVDVIDSCINKIKNEEIVFDEGTVSLMKKVLKTAVASTLEDSAELGNYVLHQNIDEESIFKFLEDMKNLEKIKSEHIYEAARKVLNNPTIHILLPEV